MPWCDPCNKYFTPNSLPEDGHCPTCGEDLSDQRDEEVGHVPWHFWLLLLAAAVYLGWRLIQGVDWVIDKL